MICVSPKGFVSERGDLIPAASPIAARTRIETESAFLTRDAYTSISRIYNRILSDTRSPPPWESHGDEAPVLIYKGLRPPHPN
jgi:hypothetical protein